MQAGDLYIAEDADLAEDSRRAISLAGRCTRTWPQDPASAVVTKDLPANVVAVGNPARIVRDLSSDA